MATGFLSRERKLISPVDSAGADWRCPGCQTRLEPRTSVLCLRSMLAERGWLRDPRMAAPGSHDCVRKQMRTHGEVWRSCTPSPSHDCLGIQGPVPGSSDEGPSGCCMQGSWGILFSVALGCGTQAQRKLMRSFKIQTRSLRFPETVSWETSPAQVPAHTWSPCPRTACDTGWQCPHSTQEVCTPHGPTCCLMASEWGQSC